MCDSVFIGNQEFEFDIYGIINTSFGFVQKLKKSIRVINITKRNIPIRCACDKCRITTKKIGPLEKIYGIPAKVYGDIIRFKIGGWKTKVITCNDTPNKLPIIRLVLIIYKKRFNIHKYILPFKYLKYKSNINVIGSNKTFEYILHEERTVVPKMNCCVFDYSLTDNKAVYILMLMMSAQLNGKEVKHTFFGRTNQETISFKT